MSLLLQAAQTALLDALQDDIIAAWAPTAGKVHRDAPEVVKSAGNLPCAYLFVTDVRPDPERSFPPCQISAMHTIVCALRFAKPATSLLDAKRAKAEALRTRVTTGPLYNGLSRRWDGETYLDPDPQEQDRQASSTWCEVRVGFIFWIDTDGA